MLQGILRWAVPDVSARLLKRIKRENFLLRERIIEYEKELTQSLAQQQEESLRLRLNGNNATTLNDNATTYV